jgi:diacylglycerol O-acyltransferase
MSQPAVRPAHHDVPWGGDASLSAWDALMWRTEADPRTSSSGFLLEMLESTPPWDEVLEAHRRTVARIPRLRDRVVEPLQPLTQPVWSPDPDFEIRRHVRRVALPDGSDERAVLDLCEELWTEPLDLRRPPWEGILVTGLVGGRAAYAFRCHHALTDGTGLVQLLALAHTGGGEPPTGEAAGTSALGLTVAGAVDLGRRVPRWVSGAARTVRQVAGRRTDAVGPAVDYVRSAGRILAPGTAPGSPLWQQRSTRNALLVVDVDLAPLRAAGRSVGGSINDAYVAAVLGGFRRYHEVHGVSIDAIPLAMPVSVRTADDAAGGNKFAGVRFAAPLGETDPAARIRAVGAFVRAVRNEPAIAVMDHFSGLLGLLPTAALVEVTARLTRASDLQVSNIPGLPHGVELAGARVERMYTLGPRPGVAAMVTLLTYDGRCSVGLTVDAELFTDLDLLRTCIVEGFDEVGALAVAEADG